MQRRRTRFATSLVTAALPLALLAGCSEDPVPKIPEEPTSSPTEAATSSEPTEPTPPAAMDRDDEAGAKAFVEYYFALIDYGVATGDTSTLQSAAAPSCANCTGVVNVIESAHKNGGSIEGGEHTVRSVRLTAQAPTEQVLTFHGTMRVAAKPQIISNSGLEGVDGNFTGGVSAYEVILAHDATGWTLGDWRPQ